MSEPMNVAKPNGEDWRAETQSSPLELCDHTIMVTIFGVENKPGFGMADLGERAGFRDVP